MKRRAGLAFGGALAAFLALALLWSPGGVPTVFGQSAPDGFVAEAVEGAAAPGTWVTSVTVQNLGTATATVQLQFYNESGPVGSVQNAVIGVAQSKLWYVPNISDLPSGTYSAVVSSDQPVAAIANLASSSPSTGGSYSGTDGASGAGTSFYIPAIYKAYYGYNSNIVVQNADAGANASVTVTFKGPGVNFTTPAVSVKPGSSHTWEQVDLPQLPNGFVGSATVNSAGADIVAIVNVYTPDPAAHLFSTTNGQAAGSTVVYLPVIYKNYYGFDTSFLVQNTSQSTNRIEVTYSNGLKEPVATLGPGESKLYFQPNVASLPGGFNGSAVVRSLDSRPLLAVANVVHYGNGRLSAYNGFADGTSIISLPAIYKWYYGWVTSLTVQNVDSVPVTVNISYSNGASEPSFVLNPGASRLFFQPNNAGLPNGFNGAATVNATGKVVAVVNEEKQKDDANSAPVGAGDWLMSYNGFGR